MACQFISDPRYNWKVEKIGSMSISYIGRYDSIKKMIPFFQRWSELKASKIKTMLEEIPGNFSIVVETDEWLLGLVDRISAYRLFYRSFLNGCNLSNSPRSLILKEGSKLVQCPDSLVEMKMAGYLSGNRTLDKNVFQLRAGEMILCNKNSDNFIVTNYFKFYTTNIKNRKNDELIEELDVITDKIIMRNIHDANGKTIWVPLSGGLDSRLIVCKLKKLGYDNIQTYSYGIVGNYDALRAKNISNKLNLNWHFIPTSSKESRKYFLSKERKNYWDFADGLSVVPNLHGMFALKSLVESGSMKPGDIVINGQSGDFITGQHIPVLEKDKVNDDELINRILDKHYSLRKELFLDSGAINLMKARIKESLGNYQNIYSYQGFAKSYEFWEWKERQAKRVVNGQCNYDYFKINWELPLWDLEYLQFWMDIPLHQKIGRNLFVEYLNKINLYGLFGDNSLFMSRWPKQRILIQFTGNIIKTIFGNDVSKKYYKKLDWYSQYQYLYALTGHKEYQKNWRNYKGPIPYMTDVWLQKGR
ncbi:hypothetical protein HN615_00490 [Candidatus Woesearchaeota archaeon]|jgi:asparagine synthase (glutamine-hydrolysing)|nr:hypothetical protein [Candidatus Woesearchaeota archaeon]